MDPDPDADPDPSIFIIDLQDANKKLTFLFYFSCILLFKGIFLHHFSKIKNQKESQNSRNQGFSYYFCMMIERSGSGSMPLTSGSGSGRPKTCKSGGSGSGSATLPTGLHFEPSSLYCERPRPSMALFLSSKVS
jgi:hypothetical protein